MNIKGDQQIKKKKSERSQVNMAYLNVTYMAFQIPEFRKDELPNK